jgi:SHS2 domain-containing protein
LPLFTELPRARVPGNFGTGTRAVGVKANRGLGAGTHLAREAMIRMLDHTADVGFEVAEAPRLEDLFDEARQALLMTVFEEPPEGGEYEDSVRLSAPDLETLLVRWINELVFLVQDDGFVPTDADLRIEEADEEGLSLEARLTGAPLDLEGYGWQGEIKSATFHGLEVTHGSLGWRAQMILDV